MGEQVDCHSHLSPSLRQLGTSFLAAGLLALQLFHTSTAEIGPMNAPSATSSKPERNHTVCMGHCGWGSKSGQRSWACCVLVAWS